MKRKFKNTMKIVSTNFSLRANNATSQLRTKQKDWFAIVATSRNSIDGETQSFSSQTTDGAGAEVVSSGSSFSFRKWPAIGPFDIDACKLALPRRHLWQIERDLSPSSLVLRTYENRLLSTFSCRAQMPSRNKRHFRTLRLFFLIQLSA